MEIPKIPSLREGICKGKLFLASVSPSANNCHDNFEDNSDDNRTENELAEEWEDEVATEGEIVEGCEDAVEGSTVVTQLKKGFDLHVFEGEEILESLGGFVGWIIFGFDKEEIK